MTAEEWESLILCVCVCVMQLSERHTWSGKRSPVHLLRQQRWQHCPCCQRRHGVHAHTPDSYVYHGPCWQKRAKCDWWVMHAVIPSGTEAIVFSKGHYSLILTWGLIFTKAAWYALAHYTGVYRCRFIQELCSYYIWEYERESVREGECARGRVCEREFEWVRECASMCVCACAGTREDLCIIRGKTQPRLIFLKVLVNLCCCQHLCLIELWEHAARTPQTSRVKKTWNEMNWTFSFRILLLLISRWPVLFMLVPILFVKIYLFKWPDLKLHNCPVKTWE